MSFSLMKKDLSKTDIDIINTTDGFVYKAVCFYFCLHFDKKETQNRIKTQKYRFILPYNLHFINKKVD